MTPSVRSGGDREGRKGTARARECVWWEEERRELEWPIIELHEEEGRLFLD